MSWTDEKVKKLKELWGKGSTASQIAEIIGGMSRNAVIGKAHRLALSSKVNNNISSGGLNSKKDNQGFQKTSKKSLTWTKTFWIFSRIFFAKLPIEQPTPELKLIGILIIIFGFLYAKENFFFGDGGLYFKLQIFCE